MKITPEQKTKYSAFMQDLWGLIKEYRNPEQAGDYWRLVRDKMTEVSKKYDNDIMVACVLLGFYDAVCKEYQENLVEALK